MKKALGCLVIIVLLFFVMMVAIGTSVEDSKPRASNKQRPSLQQPRPTEVQKRPPLSSREIQLFTDLITDDFSTYSEGDKTKTLYRELRGASERPIIASANTIQREYERNEVAADQKYRGKAIIVSSTIRSINRGVGDNYYLTLAGGSNQFTPPQAHMVDGYSEYLATLRKRQKARLFCTGGGMMVGSAILSDCVPIEAWVSEEVAKVLKELSDIATTQDRVAVVAFAFIASVSSKLPEDSVCWTKGGYKKRKCQREVEKVKLSQEELAAVAKKHGINPALLPKPKPK